MAAVYEVVGRENAWRVLHDGETSLDYATKEAAFEAAVGAAMLSLRDGFDVMVTARGSAGRSALGNETQPTGR